MKIKTRLAAIFFVSLFLQITIEFWSSHRMTDVMSCFYVFEWIYNLH